MAKVRVEATFDRADYAPGEWMRVIAMVHGESPDRVYGGRAFLINRIELTARGIRKVRDEPAGRRVPAARRSREKVAMRTIAPLGDGTPRIWCDIRVPVDARP